MHKKRKNIFKILTLFAVVCCSHATLFAANFVRDTFTDTAGTALSSHTGEVGATWTSNPAFSGTSNIVISDANRARSATNAFSVYYASGNPSSANYSVSADVYVASFGGAVGIYGRASTTSTTYYLLDYESTGVIKLYTIVNGSNLDTVTAAWNPVASSTYRLTLTMIGSTITGYIDGVQYVQKTDTNITTSGKAGLFTNFGALNTTGLHLDNFSADDVATSFTLSGPTSGGKNATSTNFSVTPNGAFTGSTTITISGGGLSTSTVLTFFNSSTTQTFTITPTSYGTVTLTPTNSGGLSNPTALTYVSGSGILPVSSSDLWENGYTSSDNPRQSPFSFLRVTTDATSIKVTGTSNGYVAYPGYASLGIRVDGVDQSPIVFTSDTQATTTVSLGTGTKTIDITTGPQNRPSSTIMGTFLDAIELLGLTSYTVVPPVSTGRLLVYGDSISVGYADSTNYGTKGWVSLLRNAGRKVMIEGFSYRSLNDDASSTRTAFVSRVTSYAPDTIWMAVGTNDYGLNRWSAASFGTAYAAMLDDLHTSLPNATIFCQTPLVRTGENANGFGSTLTDYRNQIATACNARTWTTLVDGTSIITLSDVASDHVHPNTAGHAKYENFVAPYVAVGGGVSVSLSSTAGQGGESVTATLTRALGSTFLSGDQLNINWGDGTTATITPTVSATLATTTHTYGMVTGPYSISITNNRMWPNPSAITYTVVDPPRTNAGGGFMFSQAASEDMKKVSQPAYSPQSSFSVPALLPQATSSSYVFKSDIMYESTAKDVKKLQQLLNAQGFTVAKKGAGSPGKETEYFGFATKQALIKFQEKYKKEILTPTGLKKATGIFGSSTRAFVNRMSFK